jgi:tripartite-type tricarboxylate transporter receptor subunit TctC
VKKRPGELVFSSSGMHGALHLPTALFLKAAGLQMKHLPTNGGGPALTALIGNNAQMSFSAIAAAMGQIKGGKARALACLGAQRAPALPDVPTMKELGYNLEFYLWVGMFAPKGTPEPIVVKLREEIKKAAATDQFQQAMKNLGQDVAYLDQAEFKAFWDDDAKRVEDAVRAVGKV